MRNLEIIETDFYDIISKIQAASFKTDIINEFYETIHVFYKTLCPLLNKYNEFAKLNINEKRKIIQYLLMMKMPKILEDFISN